MVTKELLHELFEYREGHLYWKVARSNAIKVGQKTGWVSKAGYVYVNLNNIPTTAHRIIFAMHHGFIPEMVDHINGHKSDNRIENLRAATRSENFCNAKTRKNNTSGIKGVEKHQNGWRVRIHKDKKSYEGGVYKTIEEASNAIKLLRSSIHGNFAKH